MSDPLATFEKRYQSARQQERRRQMTHFGPGNPFDKFDERGDKRPKAPFAPDQREEEEQTVPSLAPGPEAEKPAAKPGEVITTGNIVDRMKKEGTLGAMGDSWGMMTARGKKEWATSTRAEAEAERDRNQRHLDNLDKDIERRMGQYGFAPAHAERLRDKVRDRVKDAENRIRVVESGERPEKTALRAGVEEAASGFLGDVVGSLVEAPGIAAGFAGEEMGFEITPDDNQVKDLGERIVAFAEEQFPGDEARKREFGQKLARGFGNMVGFYGPAIIPRVLNMGRAAMTATVVATGSSVGSAQQFRAATEARRAGEDVSEGERLSAFLGGAALGATEAAPFAGLISRPAKGFAGVMSSGAANATEEALQEGFQTFGENLLAGELYDPDRDPSAGLAEGMLIGSILGFGAGTAGGTMSALRGETQEAPDAEPGDQTEAPDQPDDTTVDVVELVQQEVAQQTGAPEQPAEAPQEAAEPVSEEAEAPAAEGEEAAPEADEEAAEAQALTEEGVTQLRDTLAMAVRRGLTPDQVAQIETLLTKQAPELVEPFRQLVQDAQQQQQRPRRAPRQRQAAKKERFEPNEFSITKVLVTEGRPGLRERVQNLTPKQIARIVEAQRLEFGNITADAVAQAPHDQAVEMLIEANISRNADRLAAVETGEPRQAFIQQIERAEAGREQEQQAQIRQQEARTEFTAELRGSLRGVQSTRADGQPFTGGQIAIADAYQAFIQRTGANTSLDQFKQQLIVASRGDNPGFYLSRLDLPSLMDDDKRKASATQTRGGDQVHFVNLTEAREAVAEEPQPEQPAADLESLTKKQLVERTKQFGLTGTGRMDKSLLIENIRRAERRAAQQTPQEREETQPQEAPTDFATTIQALANRLSTPPFSKGVVVAQIYDAYIQESGEFVSLEEFKNRLLKAHNEGSIDLHPLDAPRALDDDLRERSRIETRYGWYYFVAKKEQTRQPTQEAQVAEPPVARRDPDDIDNLRQQFIGIIESTLPRRQWAERLGITEAQLQPLIDEQVEAGRLRRVKGGKVWRVAKDKWPDQRPQQKQAQGQEQQDETPSELPGANGEILVQLLQADQKNDFAAFDASIERLRSDRTFKKPDVRIIAEAFIGYGLPSSDTKARLIERIQDRHNVNTRQEARGQQIAPSAIAGQLPDQPTRQPTPGTQRPSQGLAEITEDLNRTLGLTTRQGRLDPGARRQARQAGADLRGQTSRTTGVVRLRIANEIDTLAHEGGHALENRFGAELEAVKQRFEGELRPLAGGVAIGEQLSEGFAEWFRRYALNRRAAENTAPGFLDAFEEFLDANDPGMLQRLQDIEAAYQEWVQSPSGGAIAQSIATSVQEGAVRGGVREFQEEGLRDTIDNWTNRAYTAVFDDLHPIRMAVDNLLNIAAKNIGVHLKDGQRLGVKTANDAYKMMRLARDGYAGGHMDLLYGVHPYQSTEPEGPGLREAMAHAFGGTDKSQWSREMSESFGAYLASRRFIGEWQRFLAGDLTSPPDKFSLADHQQNVAEMEGAYPQFVEAAQKVYEFQRNLLRKKREAGLISPELYDELIQKIDYAPVLRDMGRRSFFGFSAVRGQNKHSIINRFRGSQRDVINPLESIAKDAYETAMFIARNDAVKALDALARAAGPGGGAIAERIPAHEMKATQVNAVEALRNAARDAGIDEADALAMIQTVEDQLGDNQVTNLWRMGEVSERGEPIVYLWENGERVPLRLPDGEFGQMMFDAVTGLTKRADNLLTNVLAMPALAVRVGVTASPDFIVANYIRDQVSAWVLSRDFVPFVDGARGVYDDLTMRDISRIYSLAGGLMGGSNVAALHESKVKREVRQLRTKGIRITLNPFTRDFWRMTEFSETGTRLGIMRRAMDRARADGLSDWEAALEAAYAARDYIDFGRRGSKMHSARRIVPFLNAALQGVDRYTRGMRGKVDDDRVVRETISPYIKARTGQPLTTKERRRLSLATKAWAATASLGVIGILQSLLYEDDPEYEEMSDYVRATHWVFKVDGEWVRIPKPFEIAWVSNMMERSFEYAYKDDPSAKQRLVDGLYEIVAPPHSIPGLSVVTELAANHDFFSGRQIVPEHLQRLPPELQFNSYSSEFGKVIGEQLGVSPAYVDHFITGFGASYGREFVNASDHLIPALRGEEGPESSIHDYFFLRRFTKDVTAGSTSVMRFWDLMARTGGKYTQAASGYRHFLEKAADPRSASEFLKGLSKEERAYALLEANKRGRGYSQLRKLHPLNRAKDIISTATRVRKQMNLRQLESSITQERITVSPSEERMAREILRDISMREARNALVALGEEGWAQKEPMRVDTLMDELQEAVPQVYQEYVRRLRKQKLPSYEDVRANWPEARDRLLQDGEHAIIRDLYVREPM